MPRLPWTLKDFRLRLPDQSSARRFAGLRVRRTVGILNLKKGLMSRCFVFERLRSWRFRV